MLVTFHTKAWSNVTLFGDVAVTLLKMAGHSGTVPGAMHPADIPAAMVRLQRELAAIPDPENRERSPPDSGDDDTEPKIGLRSRAYPLMQLLSAAAREDSDVTWDLGAPLVV